MAREMDPAQDAQQTMMEWLKSATKEEKCEMIAELTSFRAAASSPQRTRDPRE